MEDLKLRCNRFMDELGIAATKFCTRIQLSTSAFYAWRAGQLVLSEATAQRIDEYLKKYNF